MFSQKKEDSKVKIKKRSWMLSLLKKDKRAMWIIVDAKLMVEANAHFVKIIIFSKYRFNELFCYQQWAIVELYKRCIKLLKIKV